MTDSFLIDAIRKLARPATELKFTRSENLPLLDTHYGGDPYMQAQEPWPLCGRCEKPLLFVFQGDFSRGFHQTDKALSLFTFFYCWNCHPSGTGETDSNSKAWCVRTYSNPEDTKHIATSKPAGLKPIHSCSAQLEKRICLPDSKCNDIEALLRQAATESGSVLEKIQGEEFRSAMNTLGVKLHGASYFGGYPDWTNLEDQTPSCPMCQSPMNLLGQLIYDEVPDVMWGDVGAAYLFYCRNHPSHVRMIIDST